MTANRPVITKDLFIQTILRRGEESFPTHTQRLTNTLSYDYECT
jgi:hypothetical protein